MSPARYSPGADRQKVDRLLTELSKILQAFCEHDSIVRGSFQMLRRRCGKKPCRCNDGKLHETFVFVDRSSGQRRIERATAGHQHALKKPAKKYNR